MGLLISLWETQEELDIGEVTLNGMTFKCDEEHFI